MKIKQKVNLLRLCITLSFGIFFYISDCQDTTHLQLDQIWESDSSIEFKIQKTDSICKKIDAVLSNVPFKYLHLALDHTRSQNLNEWIQRIELSLGVAYRRIDDNSNAEKFLHSALSRIEKSSDTHLLAEAYKETSFYYLYLPEYDKAYRYLQLALDIYTELGLKKEQALLYSRLGELMYSTEKYDEVLPFLFEAERLFLETDSHYEIGINYFRLSEYYRTTDQDGKAEEALNKYIEATLIDYEENARNYIAYSRRALFYTEKGLFDKAEKDFQIVYKKASVLGDSIMIGITVSEMALLFASIPNRDSAMHYLNELITLIEIDSLQKSNGSKGIFIPVDYEGIYSQMSESYYLMGEHESAYQYLQKLHSVQGRLFTQESNRILVEMQTKYETEKKEVLLSQKEREAYLYIALLGLLTLLFILAIKGYVDKRRQNNLLEQSNEQKEFLIKEIHHRVKNNLQIISSLLNLQSNVIEDDKAVSAVIDSRNRVQSMSLIHQKLYLGDHLAEVNMKDYLDEMSDHLLYSFGKSDGSITINNKIKVPPIDVDTAIPLGLIINELLTNSLKYAFPGEQTGQIDVTLIFEENNFLTLRVSDNGVGNNEARSKSYSSTKFGSNMIQIFSKKLKGEVSQKSSDNGYETSIIFKKYINPHVALN